MNILIIGNSAAGTGAIEAIRKYDLASSIVQISDEVHPIYSRCLLSYYLAGAITEKGLNYRDSNFHEKMKVDLQNGRRAVELDSRHKQVTCNDGSVYGYDRLLISTGASAKIPRDLPTETGAIFILRTVDDVEKIKQKLSRAACAVVLGGGLIGMKAACALNECGLDVKVIVRSDHVLSQMIDAGAAQIITSRLQEEGIEVLPETDLSGVEVRNGRLVSVKTDADRVIQCELLIVAKGVHPNTALIEHTDIKKRLGIETNRYMQTSDENVYAAGDVAETFDIATGEYGINALWTCAVQQGRIAGTNMIGRRTAYDGTLGMNSLTVADVPLISFGITSPKDKSKYRMLVRSDPARGIYKKIVVEDKRVKGIILVGKTENAGVLLSLIRHRTDVSGFEEELLNDRFNFGKMLKYDRHIALEMYQNA